MILKISFIFSFEIIKVNSFSAPFPLIVLSNLFILFEAKLLTNLDKLYLAKRTERCVITFLPNLPKILQRPSPYWIILDI